jgi:hypothetical protein
LITSPSSQQLQQLLHKQQQQQAKCATKAVSPPTKDPQTLVQLHDVARQLERINSGINDGEVLRTMSELFHDIMILYYLNK